jgi:acetoacetate decarboxylase
MISWLKLRQLVAGRDWLYRDAHYLVADVEVDAAAARRLTPWPLRPTAPAMASIFTAWFPHSPVGAVYREAGLFLHVEHGRHRAIFCPWMIVDNDVAMILGRELLGYPKKLGVIDWQHDGDRIESVATRRGAELVRMRAVLGETVAAPPPMLGRPHRNVRAALGLAVPWILSFTPREHPVEVRRAELTLEVGGSTYDPLHELHIGTPRAAFLHRVHLGASLAALPRPIAIASPIAHFRNLALRVD